MGHGSLGVVSLGGADPTAGLTYEFPLSVVTEVISVCFDLTTGAHVSNRQVTVQLLDAYAVPVFGVAAPGTQIANLGVLYSFGQLVPSFGSAGEGMMGGPLPFGRLPENLSLSIQVAAADAADLLTDARMLVRQWPFEQDLLGGSASG